MKITVDLDSTPDQAPAAAPDARETAALRARLRKVLFLLVVLCLGLGAAGFAFVGWLMTLPPGTIKAP